MLGQKAPQSRPPAAVPHSDDTAEEGTRDIQESATAQSFPEPRASFPLPVLSLHQLLVTLLTLLCLTKFRGKKSKENYLT